MLSKLFLLAITVGTAAAQSDYLNQSAPFNLILSSTANTTLDGLKLGACHSGASVESLCVYTGSASDNFYTFYFNTSTTLPSDPSSLPTGLLTWTLKSGTIEFNEAVTFLYNIASNLAFPMVWPSLTNQQTFTFTSEDLLAVPAYVNDAIEPPAPYTGGVTFWNNRWVVCKTYWQGYSYTALQWVLGATEPQNPSCDAVTVKRIFI
jgi:hypothetical protein